MKIAAVSEDGVTISRYFGRAPFYVAVSVENGSVLQRERREKPGYAQFSEQGHRFDAPAQARHRGMAAAISDCTGVLVGGMGAGAYQSMKDAGITPIVTDEEAIAEAIAAYLSGKLVDHSE